MKLSRFTLKFPHISRQITAWSMFMAVLLLNATSAFLPSLSEEMKLRQEVIKNPFSSLSHQNLANFYLKFNLEEAEREFYLAESFSDVLGAQFSPLTVWSNLLNYREKVVSEIKSWEELGKKYPDYEYGKLKLASLYYQLGNKEMARLILQKLEAANPTFSPPSALQSLSSPRE